MLQILAALALQVASQQIPAKASDAFFMRFDTNRDDKITKAEFEVAALRFDTAATAKNPSEKGQAAAMLAKLFKKMDKDGDDIVTRGEYQSGPRG